MTFRKKTDEEKEAIKAEKEKVRAEKIKAKKMKKKGLFMVKTIRPLYNHRRDIGLLIPGAPLHIPCGWLGTITEDIYKMFGGDKGPFIILDK